MRLIEISAWNDSGGGFLHRLFDGHSQLDCWPFELLLGNDVFAPDAFSPQSIRGRFRWPRLQGLTPSNGAALFDQISDGELKPVLLDAQATRHHEFHIPVSLNAWREAVVAAWSTSSHHDQSTFLALYIESFLNLRSPGRKSKPVLGHCPAIVLDAAEVWADFPDAQLLHVIRSPLAGYADMNARHPQLLPETYAAKWSLVNGLAATLATKYPALIKLVAFDGLVHRREQTMTDLCQWLRLTATREVYEPTWNGRPLDPARMAPFGGVPNIRAGRDAELSAQTQASVREAILRITAGARALLAEIQPETMHFTG